MYLYNNVFLMKFKHTTYLLKTLVLLKKGPKQGII